MLKRAESRTYRDPLFFWFSTTFRKLGEHTVVYPITPLQPSGLGVGPGSQRPFCKRVAGGWRFILFNFVLGYVGQLLSFTYSFSLPHTGVTRMPVASQHPELKPKQSPLFKGTPKPL